MDSYDNAHVTFVCDGGPVFFVQGKRDSMRSSKQWIYSCKLDHSCITQTNVVEEEGKTYAMARGDGCCVEEHVVFTGT